MVVPTGMSRSWGQGFGKIFIAGEYGVLTGGTAIVWGLEEVIAHTILWEDGSYDTQMDHFYNPCTGRKWGLGGSAARIVSVMDMRIRSGYEDDSGWGFRELREGRISPHLRMCVDEHRALQGGMGSGADVVASALGGLLKVRGCPDDIVVERLEMPCEFSLYRTGIEAFTTEYLSAFFAAYDAGKPGLDEILGEIDSIAVRAADCISAGDLEGMRSALGLVDEVLGRLGKLLGKDIVPESYLELKVGIEASGKMCKFCGCGGGDTVLVF